jgi:hypothetical protein
VPFSPSWTAKTSRSFWSCSRIARCFDCSLRSLRLALVSRCLPHSLADEKHVCSLARPGQRRASLAQHGGRAISDARSWVDLGWVRARPPAQPRLDNDDR